MGLGKAHSCSCSLKLRFMRGPTCIINRLITKMLLLYLGLQMRTCAEEEQMGLFEER